MFNFRSVRFKLIFIFSMFAAIILLIIAIFLWYGYKTGQIEKNIAELNKLNLTSKDILITESNFTIYETINPNFFKTGKSTYIDRYQALLADFNSHLISLEKNLEFPKALKTKFKSISEMRSEVNKLQQKFDAYIIAITKRGFKDDGLEGDMRKIVHDLEGYKQLDLAKLLMIRRHEKDYLLRKEEAYIVKLKEAIQSFQMDVRQKIKEPFLQAKVIGLSEEYFKIFLEIFEMDKLLGLQGKSEGLRNEISAGMSEIERDLDTLNQYMSKYSLDQKKQINTLLIIIVLILLVIGLFLIGIVIRSLGRSIGRLSKSINTVIQLNFSKEARISTIKTGDEIEKLSEDVTLMLEKVHQRTDEVLDQKEVINQAYQRIELLSKIGKKITNELDIHKIIHMFYDNLIPLIDATVIAVGIYEESQNALQFYGNDGEKIASSLDSLEDEHLFSVQCFKFKKRIFVENLSTEEEAFVYDASRKSIIYEPLVTGNKKLGVITVQHVQPFRYQEYHRDTLRNIAIYTAIALDNAQVYEILQQQSNQLHLKNDELIVSEEELKQVAEELSTQRDLLEEQNNDILSSITYAKGIQQAIVPSKLRIKESIQDFFIIFKPRDLVSGDFYWFAQKGSKIILAAIDCTGHGVPGAFMSMIGNQLLNHIVHDREIFRPDKILNEMHKGIRYALKQNETGNRDGMDVTLIVIDQSNNQIEYAGANNSLIYIQDGQLSKINGDKMPIGGEQREIERIFTPHSISLLSVEDQVRLPTMLYLYSDGYQDQFGGPKGKKFLSTRLRAILLEIHSKTMEEQKEILNRNLKDWMAQSNQSQIDDIMLMGLRV